MPFSVRFGSFAAVSGLIVALTGCGASKQPAASPHGDAALTTAHIDGGHLEKILVADHGSVSIVERDGCMATVHGEDEIHMRCAKPERMKQWFADADRAAAKVAVEKMSKHQDEADDDEPDTHTPSAKMLTSSGTALKVVKPADIEKLNAEVRALSAELAGAEKDVTPGPATANGWQMLHVAGPARIMFAGAPAHGRLEAKMSTNGQYLCEFTTAGADGQSVKATKSGWLKPASAARAIDVVLGPWSLGAGDARGAFAAGTKGGTEVKSNAASTAAVFELFGEVQDALGDACLPELESPAAASGNANPGSTTL